MILQSLLTAVLVVGASGARDPGHQNHYGAVPTAISGHGDVSGTSYLAGTVVGALLPRQTSDTGALLCSPNQKCADGSCCGTNGICGYGPDYCGPGKCSNNCDAKAMCGIYSEGGVEKCGLNLCCGAAGWCGTSENHCGGPKDWPCQEGFGSCKTVPPPSCGTGSGSTLGRRIGYYQSYNVRDRVCMKVRPADINSTGYTHLYFAFASMNPATFEVVPADPGDVQLMREFTALQGPYLKTWIAIGGYGFSDNTSATHTTWSDMASTSQNRAVFIQSLIRYMETYGFTGADLDWEYPVAPERGGRNQDVVNFVSLIKEMREAFGDRFGISLALAPDYWYLRYFDVKAMEPYVDFFGFMAYDLHGPWDSDVDALGSIVRGQADVREINNNTLPLWFAGLNPHKINFGVAYYGRGYTVADPSCNTLGCAFTGASKPAPCTNSPGVMSLTEIQALIKEKKLKPRLLGDSMMKEITWDDQWIGYDDDETIEMKRKFANNLCFGGTMAWSIDFNSGTGSGLEPPTTIDGSCGVQNGGTICGNAGFGSCCSVNGWCGDSEGHCKSGCQSGNCTKGYVTTDGTCGAGHHNSICGNWPRGNCCSAAGFCGSTPDHCGKGCQSGDCIAPIGCQPGDEVCIPEAVKSDSWTKVPCTADPIKDASVNPKLRWDAAFANEAWEHAKETWKKDSRLTFSRHISNVFHGPDNFDCDVTASENGCRSYIQCTEAGHPAGFLIQNSMITVSNAIWNIYDALGRVHASVGNLIEHVADNFAPLPEDNNSMQIFISAMGMFFGVWAAPLWNSGLQTLKAFKDHSETFNNAKDITNVVIGSSTTILKDVVGSTDPANIGKGMKVTLEWMVKEWYKSLAEMQTALFNGTNMNNLTSLMTNGSLLNNEKNAGLLLSEAKIRDAAEKTIYAVLIPQAWDNAPDQYVFAADMERGCDDKIGKLELDESDATIDKAKVCINKRMHILLSAKGNGQRCWVNQGAGQSCYDLPFSLAPGWDALDTKAFGGLTKREMIEGAIKSDMQDGLVLLPSTDVDVLIEHGITTPGVIRIPACTIKSARKNWNDRMDFAGPKRWSTWPCGQPKKN